MSQAAADMPGDVGRQEPATTSGGEAGDYRAKLRKAAESFMMRPSICKRRRLGEPDIFQQINIQVHDWATVKRNKQLHGLHPSMRNLEPSPAEKKVAKVAKAKGNASGRTYTSKFRGVHQTFPTKRWEAQFRRNGKPTSLGCFDHEEEAARAYDKMMLWCELHNTAGVKGGITNFDPAEYEADIPWLQSISQDELVQSLRSDGRRQAAQRMLRQKRDGQILFSSGGGNQQSGGSGSGGGSQSS